MQTIDLRQAIGNLVTHLDNRPRAECMEYRLVNCASPEVAFAGFGDGPYVPGFSPLGKTVRCIRIDGHDAIVRLRVFQQELRPAVEAAFADDSVRFIADELAYGIPFLPVIRDETVNQSGIAHVRDPDTGELRPTCEYVRADYLEALKGALSRFPVTEPADAIDYLVTLSQMVPLTGRTKRTLENWKGTVIPEPDECGGDGKADRWYYQRIRKAIEKHVNRILPERFPGSQIRE